MSDELALAEVDETAPDTPAQRQPVRLTGWAALGVGLVLMVSVGLLIDPSSWRTIVALALLGAASQVSGIEWAVGRAWSPASVRRVIAEVRGQYEES